MMAIFFIIIKSQGTIRALLPSVQRLDPIGMVVLKWLVLMEQLLRRFRGLLLLLWRWLLDRKLYLLLRNGYLLWQNG